MASTLTLPNSLRKTLADGTIDLDSDTVMCAMLTSGYTLNAAHSIFADVSANEVASGSGYTTGGVALANKSMTLTGAVGKFTADPATWAGITKTYRYLVLYSLKTINGVTNPLIALILVDNTPADIVITSADYSVQWNANGILTLS